MALKLETTIKRYVGDTLDDAPRPGRHPTATFTHQDLPPGSTFLNKEDGRLYRWDGTDYFTPSASDNLECLLGEILLELRALREHAAIGVGILA